MFILFLLIVIFGWDIAELWIFENETCKNVTCCCVVYFFKHISPIELSAFKCVDSSHWLELRLMDYHWGDPSLVSTVTVVLRRTSCVIPPALLKMLTLKLAPIPYWECMTVKCMPFAHNVRSLCGWLHYSVCVWLCRENWWVMALKSSYHQLFLLPTTMLSEWLR